MKIQRRMRLGEVMGDEHIHDDEENIDGYDNDTWGEDA